MVLMDSQALLVSALQAFLKCETRCFMDMRIAGNSRIMDIFRNDFTFLLDK